MSFLADIDENNQALVPVNHKVATNQIAKTGNIFQPKSTSHANIFSNQQFLQQRNLPMFANCHIGNITISMPKKY